MRIYAKLVNQCTLAVCSKLAILLVRKHWFRGNSCVYYVFPILVILNE